MIEPFIKFKLMRDGAQLPKRGTDGSGGFDFFAPEDGSLAAGEKRLIPSGIAHEIPAKLYLPLWGAYDSGAFEFSTPFPQQVVIPVKIQGILFDRSGLGGKKNIRLSFACLIDNDYRGEIWLSLENHGTESFSWKRGDRLTQIAYVPVYAGEVAETKNLSDTHRGEGGFGSTGR
jgi:dUTP pyrophosphatase